MMLKEIYRKVVQAFRQAKATDEKVASSIATSLNTIVERAREYEEQLPMLQVIQSLAEYGWSTDEAACAIAKVMSQKPKSLRPLTNNWRKMHGLPMHRKPTAFRKRRKSK